MQNVVPGNFISFILHAHLPFVRHPENEFYLEERWLFEAISETYLPLLRVFHSLEKDNIPFRLTMSFSATLLSMLADPLLQTRYIEHLDRMIGLIDREFVRLKDKEEYSDVLEMYRNMFRQNKTDFEELYQSNIISGFRYFHEKGNLELITTSATHAFLPNYSLFKEAIKAQIHESLVVFETFFDSKPSGIWLPECGYYPGLENIIKDFDLSYFISSAHGVLNAEVPPVNGVYAPVSCPNGTAIFARDRSASAAIWSPDGYPGHYSYREFYQDAGYILDPEYLGDYFYMDTRINTGLKYWSITDKNSQVKKTYKPEVAAETVKEHASNFLYMRHKQIRDLAGIMDRSPVVTVPFDAELFGHWWFEGPAFIEEMFRTAHENYSDLNFSTPSDYLSHFDENQTIEPVFSSWGDRGYAQVWIDGSNDWIYRHTHKITELMVELCDRYPDESGLRQRALNQAAREVLLSQASDWPFIMKTGTTTSYSTKRVKEHIYNFMVIYESLCQNKMKTQWLTRLEKMNNLFPDLNYRVFKKK